MSMSCENPRAALFPTDHAHVHVRGSCKTVENKWISVAGYSGMYTGVQGTLYAQCLKKALVDVRTRGGVGPTTKLLKRASSLKETREKYNAEATKSSAGFIGAEVITDPTPCVMTIYKNETQDLDTGSKSRIPNSTDQSSIWGCSGVSTSARTESSGY